MASAETTPVGDDARQLAMYLIDTYFKTQPYVFTKHHIDSYDQFLGKDLPALIKSQNPILILKDQIPNTEDYRYKVEIFVGGEDGSKIEIGSPTVALQNTEEVRLLFPNEARLRNLTYSSLVLAEVLCRITITTVDPKQPTLPDVQVHERTFSRFPLFRIPIMLHSSYCNLHNKSQSFLEEAGEDPQDHGGYFIVDGSEKVLITAQEQAFNTLYINKQPRDPKVSHFASVSCLSPETRQVKRVSFYYTRETVSKGSGLMKFATLQVGLPFVRKAVPLFVLFRALGYQTDKEIVRLILPDPDSAETRLLEPYLIDTINEAYPFLDTYSAIQYIKSLTKGFSEAHVLDVLVNQFFIHIDPNQPAARASFLGDCARRILRVVAGLDPITDKDDIRNQRCLVSGFSTQMLFSGIYNTWIKAISQAIDKQYNYNVKLYSGINFLNIFSPGNTNIIFQPILITEGIMRAFKGRWGNGYGEEKAGLIQQLSRMSYLDFMSHCRRVVLDFDTGMKLTGPRHLHPSQFGYFCTNEVPSGAAIGITKNLSMMTAISTSSDPRPIINFLFKRRWVLSCGQTTDEQRAAYVPFFLNGGLLGYTEEPAKVAAVLRLMKRTGCIAPLASVGFSIRDRRVFLYVDEGRPLRPLIYLLESQKFPMAQIRGLKTWRELVCGTARENIQIASTDFVDPLESSASATLDEYITALKPKTGAIEYIDPYESNEAFIATFPDYINPETTHVEIHPSTILSILTGVIPFPNHNQSPRNQLGDSQSKQGLSLYAGNYVNRFDNTAHVLSYGEAPLVRTLYYDYIGEGKRSYGTNCILAIASFTGYNQEDGIVMNKDSIMRGMFRSLAFKSYSAFEEDDPISKAKTRIGNPAKVTSWTDLKPGVDYGKLDDNGIVKVGEYVDEHTVICGRYIMLPGGQVKDASLTAQVWTRGRVEKVAVLVNPNGLRLVKIRVVHDRTPELGDKFCLTPDHDVLTKTKGWVPITDITVNDEVAQLNREKNVMEYVKPKEVFVFDHTGDMYEIETQGVSLKTTLNHRMYVATHENNYSLIKAATLLGKSHKYLTDTFTSVEVSENDGKIVHNYSGKVYCLSVPSEVFLVRRNARVVWTGNSNRHGQKGTLGMLVRAHDMPRTATGMTPDFIMNPHAIPSRMTIGQLLENLLGKAAANLGTIGNGTAFMNQGSPHEDIGVQLERLGFEKYGNEILYNGMTGEQIPSAIFIAPVFAMRLKHMTEDKWNARAEGRREQRTHQPTGGRGAQGGLRIGEMERDAISGHGVSAFTRESFMKRSDGTSFIVCEGCGTIPIYNERQNLYVCPLCDGPVQYAGESSKNIELIPPVKRAKARFSRIEVPYAMVLLGQELESYMNISMRYLTQKSLRTINKPDAAVDSVDLTLVNTPLPLRPPPPPQATASVLPPEGSILESVVATATAAAQTITGQEAPQGPATAATAAQQQQQQESPLENMSALPQIPETLKNVKSLEQFVAEQEVALEIPPQLAQQPPQQQSQSVQPPGQTITLTEQVAAAPIGTAPPPVQGEIPAPPPPAQVLASPTAVAPVIMVDTTPSAMTAEGLAASSVTPQQQQQQRTIRIKRPKPIGGGGDEGEDDTVPKNYSQHVSFVKLS